MRNIAFSLMVIATLAFGKDLSLSVMSYVGKIEYATREFGPWKSLEVDETIPATGYLRVASGDSAELLRSDGVVIRLLGNTMVSIQSLLEKPKPKQTLSGLFRKKPPLIEIQNEVAAAAVRGSIQGTSSPEASSQPTRSGPSPLAGTRLGISGFLSSQRQGIRLHAGYSNTTWNVEGVIPLMWDTNGWITTQWQTLDGWLACLDHLEIGQETGFFFLLWGEKTISLGEGFLFDRSVRHFFPSHFSENIVFAQINFGDVGIHGFLDRPADPDLWAIEAYMRPLWGSSPMMDKLIIKGFVVNERDMSTAFFPADFQTTQGPNAYATGYGVSVFLPLLDSHGFTLSLTGELDGLNEKRGLMGGVHLGYDRIGRLSLAIGQADPGFVPWFFDTFSRYTRPTQASLLSTSTNQSLAWSIDGVVGPTNILCLFWSFKHREYAPSLLRVGLGTGETITLFSLWAGMETMLDTTPWFFSRTLSLIRLGVHVGSFSITGEYTQALQDASEGSLSLGIHFTFASRAAAKP